MVTGSVWRDFSMNCDSVIELEKRFGVIEIPQIPDTTNFWMLRSKGGFFYEEFIRERFVGLAWNYIEKNTSFEKNNIEQLKEGIKYWYSDKVPMTAINKCNRFINEIKEGDYVAIPSKGSAEIALCRFGEYFETDYDVSKEILEIKKIENKDAELGTVKCPYKKRRKIEVLIRIKTVRLGPHLIRAISSYHGLSDMNSYAIDILNCIYDCYIYQNSVMFSINISKKTPIKAREMSKLMYGITEMFCSIIDEECINITANINSPGKVVTFLKNCYDKLGKNAWKILLLYVAIFGGSAFGFEFNGIAGSATEIIKEIRTMDIDVALRKEELNEKRLDNCLKTVELIKAVGGDDVDIQNALLALETMDSLNESLQFKSNEEFAKQQEESIKNK
jgi:hypothetical protein